MELFAQLPGEAGIFQTARMMKELVNKNYLHPWIRERAAELVRGCHRNLRCEEDSLTNYVRNTIQYLRDPVDVEALHDPVTFYERRIRTDQNVFGDCDDMSIYLATLLKAIGHSPKFRIMARTGNEFHHVHVICHNNLLDSTMSLGNYPTQYSRAVQVTI